MSLGTDSESTRIRHLRECIITANIASKPQDEIYPGCNCPTLDPPVQQVGTTPNQLSYILAQAVKAPVTYTQPNALAMSGAQPVYTTPIPYFSGATEPPQGPAVLSVERQFLRIRSLDEISKPIPGRSDKLIMPFSTTESSANPAKAPKTSG